MSENPQSAPSNTIDKELELQMIKSQINELFQNMGQLNNGIQQLNQTLNNTYRQEPEEKKNNGRKSTPFSHQDNINNSMLDELNNGHNNNSFVRKQKERIGNGLIKLQTVEAFKGKPGTDAFQIMNFIGQMEIYLKAVEVEIDSPESLSIALMSIKDHAYFWYQGVILRNPELISNWVDLKKQLLMRYQPVGMEQIALNKLLDAKFHIHNEQFQGSVELYNSGFMNQLLLLPELNNPSLDRVVMGIYAKGIRGRGMGFIAIQISNAMNSKGNDRVETINELMNVALLAEQNYKKSLEASQDKTPVSTSINYNNRNNTTSINNNNRNNKFNKSFSSPSRPNNNYNNYNNHNNSTPKKLSFTPSQKVNNINNHNYEDEEINNISFHDEPDTNAELEDELLNDAEELNNINNEEDRDNNIDFLAALKVYDRMKQSNNPISADEMDRRIKNKLCFWCGSADHFEPQCPKKQNNNNKTNTSRFPKRK